MQYSGFLFQWEWLVPLKDMKVKEPEEAVFECEFSVPNVNVTWSLKSEPVENSPKYTIKADGKKHSLTVTKCRPVDQGPVSCTYGEFTTSANLDIERKFIHVTFEAFLSIVFLGISVFNNRYM